jgi:hypothetical protein
LGEGRRPSLSLAAPPKSDSGSCAAPADVRLGLLRSASEVRIGRGLTFPLSAARPRPAPSAPQPSVSVVPQACGQPLYKDQPPALRKRPAVSLVRAPTGPVARPRSGSRAGR